MSDVEFELYIRKGGQPGHGRAEVRIRTQGQSVGDAVVVDQEISFDPVALLAAGDDEREYGRVLTRRVFEAEAMRLAWTRARTIADVTSNPLARGEMLPLRLRLRLHPDFQGLRWETLRDPQEEGRPPLYKDLSIAFSRYIDSQDLRSFGVPERPMLKALVVAADPVNLDEYRLGRVDAEGEARRVREALGDIPCTILGRGTAGPPATLNRIIDALRDGHSIAYIACHGTVVDGVSHLVLEDEDGRADRVQGSELVERVRGLSRRPLLVLLASCRSAQADPGLTLRSVGPELAAAGVSAVIAMQGDVPMKTVERLMPRFFRELRHDGQVDRALAVAIGDLVEGDPWWMPVLFLRVHDGRLWTDGPAILPEIAVEAPRLIPDRSTLAPVSANSAEEAAETARPILDLSTVTPSPLPGTPFKLVPRASFVGELSEFAPTVTDEDAREAIRVWVSFQGKHWPPALTAEAVASVLRPCSVLVMLFDADAECDWWCLVGRDHREDQTCTACGGSGKIERAQSLDRRGTGSVLTACETCQGRGEVVKTTVTWEPETGSTGVRGRNHGVPNAHHRLPKALAIPRDQEPTRVSPGTSTADAPVILPGETETSALKGRAEQQVMEALESASNATASKLGKVQDLSLKRANISKFRARHVLYPVFVGSYAFEGRDHLVYVDRSSGEVHVDVPLSTQKALEAAAWRTGTIVGIAFFLVPVVFVVIFIIIFIYNMFASPL